MNYLDGMYSGANKLFNSTKEWLTTPADYSHENARAIGDFKYENPAMIKDKDDAMIKADSYGRLYHAGSTSWVSVKLGWATELPGTVEAISDTFAKMHALWNQSIDDRVSPVEAIKNLKLNQQMVKGLEKIKNVYTWRYQGVAKGLQGKALFDARIKEQALNRLNLLFDQSLESFKLHIDKVNENYREFKGNMDLEIQIVHSQTVYSDFTRK